MQINRRITNGLAWAGAFLVVGVPTADLLSAQFLGDATSQTASVAVIEPAGPIAPSPLPASSRPAAPKPVQLAAVEEKPATPPVAEPAAPALEPAQPLENTTAAVADPVDSYIQSGKPLPAYISGGDTQPTKVAAVPPAFTKTAVTAPETVAAAPASTAAPEKTDPLEVASLPAKAAPIPMPLSMRPKAPVQTKVAVAPSRDPIVIPPSVAAPTVTAADLEDWESGPLSEFLARRGQQGDRVDAGYEPDGFFLDEAPQPRRVQRDRVIGPVDEFFFPFMD
ncbi:hypothetical protein [Devosia sp. RR2S18]|uniref:hypothetical protein n=1 Tax=Devosia rhizosphaerae TaxID=3049774 RepID=UPI00254058CB|nr:hypothetical protein [Devosia sp. RR2S18]WIJ26503.1 hypothetical protein QOV41_07015 [Devosia sp. RR2S18]